MINTMMQLIYSTTQTACLFGMLAIIGSYIGISFSWKVGVLGTLFQVYLSLWVEHIKHWEK